MTTPSEMTDRELNLAVEKEVVGGRLEGPPPYDADEAMYVLFEMVMRGWHCEIDRMGDDAEVYFLKTTGPWPFGLGRDKSPYRAICEAAVAAIRSEKVK